MRLRTNDQAASPLVVIATFVLVAVVVTAGAYALFFDRPDAALGLVEQRSGGNIVFNVTKVAGGLTWDGLTLHLLDRAGIDQANTFLHAPTGKIATGHLVTLHPTPPSGTYLLIALHQGHELVRLIVQV